MGNYGKAAERLIQNQQPIVIIFEDSIENSELLEAGVILSKKGKEVEIYIRDFHQATSGTSIPKSKETSTMNHSASVKLQTPKEIVGDKGVPIEIHGNKVDFDEETYPSLQKVPKNVKKIAQSFIKDNITELNDMWKNKNSRKDIENWKKIIDRSYKDIKKIKSVDKSIIDYLDSKKKGIEPDEDSK